VLLHKQLHYYTPLVYQEASIPEVTVIFNTLSLREINTVTSIYNLGKTEEYIYRICEIAIIKIETLEDNTLHFSSLSNSILKEIAAYIIKVSSISQKDYQSIMTTSDLYFSDILSTENWKCEVCKRKRLQGSRNCGFLGEQDKSPDFKLVVNNNLYTHCPVYDMDLNILSIGIEAYNIFKAGFLPDTGGWFDQTQTFCIFSVLINNSIENRKRNQMELELAKSKQR
jgi:Iap family predicted aminopeptidase